MTYRAVLTGFLCFTIVYAKNLPLFEVSELQEYFRERNATIRNTNNETIGAKLSLTQKELLVNNILMTWKNEEFDEGLADPRTFLAGQHFFKARSNIRNSKVFKIIEKLPKGASLHAHDTALVSEDYVFNNITFRDNLYGFEDESQTINLKFFKNDPGQPWVLISKLRQQDEDFNRRLRKQISLVRDNPDIEYADVHSIWPTFQKTFSVLDPLLTFQPVFEDYFYQALKELYDDNVRYLEFRGLLPELYDLEGRTYGPEEVVQIYYDISRKFSEDYLDFWGVKFIFAPMRFTDNTGIEQYADFLSLINTRFPNFLAGFDLVGQEDTGPPLKDFVPALLQLKKITNFFFHAGETLWSGVHVDENLIDAVLLNSSRIGHGYAIVKHPEVLKIVKERNIAVEICPISNQVLGLLRDLRNHPGNYLIANNYPVVIASDDPGLWGSIALSYDWYLVFMAMARKQTDLRLLKQLAINSITYSSMHEELKQTVLKNWEKDWIKFINYVIDSNEFDTNLY